MRTDLSRITQDQVVVCGDEIGSHLLDHANWRNPILPQLPGCPAVLFNSLMFNDSGKDWVCLSGQKGTSLKTVFFNFCTFSQGRPTNNIKTNHHYSNKLARGRVQPTH